MKLQHAIGGLEGLDDHPLDFEKRVFVEDWETRIFGIHTAMMALSDSLRDAVPGYDMDAVPTAFRDIWTWADLRTGAEGMNPFDYFRLRYYEKWLGGITAYLVEHGYLTQAELDERIAQYRADPRRGLPSGGHPGIDDQVHRYLRAGDTPRRGPATPRFAAGDAVTVADPPPAEHTRLPGYLRNRHGVVTKVFEGNYGYLTNTGPDGLGAPMPVYLVRFEPDELWGADTEPNAGPLFAEIYQTYLRTEPDGD